ncbi:MAG: hypothetical protein O3A00_03090 [Planctomycetota bacterium]|nr:hypothetical protein [Planctomycetota bacterium]
MTVVYEEWGGRFTAKYDNVLEDLLGEGESPGAALESLEAKLTRRIEDRGCHGLFHPNDEFMQLAGSCADDPTIVDIVNEAYAERDRERDMLEQ